MQTSWLDTIALSGRALEVKVVSDREKPTLTTSCYPALNRYPALNKTIHS